MILSEAAKRVDLRWRRAFHVLASFRRLTLFAAVSGIVIGGSSVRSLASTAEVKHVAIIRVYFAGENPQTTRCKDAVNKGKEERGFFYCLADLHDFFSNLERLWQLNSAGRLTLDTAISPLIQIKLERSGFLDKNDGSGYFHSSDAKFYDLMLLAIDGARQAPGWTQPDWQALDGVAVLIAGTNPTTFYRGLGSNACMLPLMQDSGLKRTGCAIFGENPGTCAQQTWGVWEHEIGHAFQIGGPPHPSGYASGFELMDSNLPGRIGAFERMYGFNWSVRTALYQPSRTPIVTDLSPMEEENPAAPQALKIALTDDEFYLVTVRQRELGDDDNQFFKDCQAAVPGIPDEGVLIEHVDTRLSLDSGWVTLEGGSDPSSPGNRGRQFLWHVGDKYVDPNEGLYISVLSHSTPTNTYTVSAGFGSGAPSGASLAPIPSRWATAIETAPPELKFVGKPDVRTGTWRDIRGVWQNPDIWIDSPVNGFGVYRYGFSADDPSLPASNGDEPAVGLVNRVYARVMNGGPVPASNVVVHFYVAESDLALVGPQKLDDLGTSTIDKIASHGYKDVFVNWTPHGNASGSQQVDRRRISVKIDHVDNEAVLPDQSNQLVDVESFEILSRAAQNGETLALDAGQSRTFAAPIPQRSIYSKQFTLVNPDPKNPTSYLLSWVTTLPPEWHLRINGGNLSPTVQAGQSLTVPVVFEPSGFADLGTKYTIDVTISKRPKDKDYVVPIGGEHIETRVLLESNTECRFLSGTRTVLGSVRSAAVGPQLTPFSLLLTRVNPFISTPTIYPTPNALSTSHSSLLGSQPVTSPSPLLAAKLLTTQPNGSFASGIHTLVLTNNVRNQVSNEGRCIFGGSVTEASSQSDLFKF